MPSASPRARSRPARRSWCIAGGVESMTRAPFVMGKAEAAFCAQPEVYDTTIGWRFVNPLMKEQLRHRFDARDGRERRRRSSRSSARDQDAFALRSQQRAGGAQASGRFARGDRAGDDPAAQGRAGRRRTRRASARRTPPWRRWRSCKPFRKGGTVTAGNASGINDGACAAAARFRGGRRSATGSSPRARVVGMATAGVAPRIMGIGPAPGDAQGAGARAACASATWTSSS